MFLFFFISIIHNGKCNRFVYRLCKCKKSGKWRKRSEKIKRSLIELLNNDLGGDIMCYQLDNDLRVSELDKHPNELGQIKIMEILYDWLGPRISNE